MWLCIKNEHEFPIEALSLGGFTTKRGDSNTIGEFGTGRIYAFILSLKLNIPVVLQTKSAIVKPISETLMVAGKELERLAFEVKRGKQKEIVQTSFTLDMGKNWETPYQMFREFYANAYDEMLKMPEMTFEESIFPQTEVAEGTTLLYIKVNREIKEIYNNIDYYFPLNRTPIYQDYQVKILSYQGTGVSGGVYVKGVLVQTIEDSIFSYQIDNLRLNEERNVASVWSMESRIEECLLNCDDVFVVDMLLKHINRKTFENRLLARMGALSDKAKSVWRTSFRLEYGDNACIQTDRLSSANAIMNAYKPIKLENSVVEFAQQFAPSDANVELIIQRNRMVLQMKNDTLDLQQVLLEAKTVFRATGQVTESALNTKVEFDPNTLEPVGIEQGVIVLNPKFFFSVEEFRKCYLRGVVAVMNDISTHATGEKIEEMYLDFVERTLEQNSRESLADAIYNREYKLEYDGEKKKLKLPLSSVVPEAMDVEIVGSGKSLEFRTTGEEETRVIKTTLANALDKPFALKAKLGYANSSYFVRLPQKVAEAINFEDAVFVTATA